MLEATTDTRIHGQQQFGKCLCVARSQPTSDIFSYVFFVRKYFYNENKANYGNLRCGSNFASGVAKLGHTGARALVTRGCVPPMQALLKIIGAECTTVINRELGAKRGQSLVSQATP